MLPSHLKNASQMRRNTSGMPSSPVLIQKNLGLSVTRLPGATMSVASGSGSRPRKGIQGLLLPMCSLAVPLQNTALKMPSYGQAYGLWKCAFPPFCGGMISAAELSGNGLISFLLQLHSALIHLDLLRSVQALMLSTLRQRLSRLLTP